MSSCLADPGLLSFVPYWEEAHTLGGFSMLVASNWPDRASLCMGLSMVS